MRDPYSVLGVQKSASESDIKSAYRKLAKRYHPDQNAGDPKAQEKFAQVNAAYEILGDGDKRGQFDRGEIDAEGKPRGFAGNPFGGGSNPFGGGFNAGRRSGDPSGGFSAEDILSEIFGGSGKRPKTDFGGDPFDAFGSGRRSGPGPQQAKGEDVQATLTVELEDLASDEKVRVELPTGKPLSVTLPKGVEDGQTIRLKGQGQPNPYGKPGDALVTVRFRRHPLFKLDGDNLTLSLPLTLYEAVLGTKVTVPVLGGQVVMSIPKGTSGGRVLRIKGRGILKKDGTRGDVLATLQIMLPEGGSADLETMMEVWRDQRPYTVRGDGF